MIEIIPAILSRIEEDYKRDIERYNQSQLKLGWLHVDFMDNLFVPNKSVDVAVTIKYPVNFKKEAHLMVKQPLQWLEGLFGAGFERIFLHFEAEETGRCIGLIKDHGLEAGLVLNPETDVENVVSFMDKIDRVLLMGIDPGFQGKEFMPQAYERVKEISRLRSKNNSTFKIGVDGGVKDKNAKQLIEAGADFLVIGSFFLKGDIDENLKKILEKIKN